MEYGTNFKKRGVKMAHDTEGPEYERDPIKEEPCSELFSVIGETLKVNSESI